MLFNHLSKTKGRERDAQYSPDVETLRRLTVYLR